jgi:O-acetyl-ADP-ribose deacetylase (regulator of RNase III)
VYWSRALLETTDSAAAIGILKYDGSMTPEVLASRKCGNVYLQAVLGDLTTEEVDAVVNAANSHLIHGGGLAAAIVDKGGMIIQLESSDLAPVAVGHAAVTSAGDLPARWIIHAVGPEWGCGDEETKLRSAVRSALDAAHDLGAESVALPAISTGIFGYPKAEGTRVIIDEVHQWLGRVDTALTVVRFTASDAETANLFAGALGRHSG